jgi:hypothetical protein
MSDPGHEYLPSTIRRLKYYKDLAEKTFDQLHEGDFHYAPNEESNSIAVIIQHMAGNMLSRWTNFLIEDGEKEWRQRDDEFAVHNYTKQKLIELWDKGWKCFLDAIESLTAEDLLKTIYIRKEAMPAIDAINRQFAHYPYHIGQIVYLGRMIRGKEWKSLSIPKGESEIYNTAKGMKDPAKNY